MSLPIDTPFIIGWKKTHTLKRNVSIRFLDQIGTPLTYGIWRPMIILPKLPNNADTEQLNYVLTHEYMHIKRFDALIKWLLTVALCIHWFNPLVWVMYTYANRDIEIACDEATVQTLGITEKSAYALTLVTYKEKRQLQFPTSSSFNKNVMEERIFAIMKFKKASTITSILSAFILLIALSIFAASTIVNTSAATLEEFNEIDNSGDEMGAEKEKAQTDTAVRVPIIAVDNAKLSYAETGNKAMMQFETDETEAVYSLQSGTVIYADRNRSSGYQIQVQQNDGYIAVYSHLQWDRGQQTVSSGQTIQTGTTIGYTGNTGIADGNKNIVTISIVKGDKLDNSQSLGLTELKNYVGEEAVLKQDK